MIQLWSLHLLLPASIYNDLLKQNTAAQTCSRRSLNDLLHGVKAKVVLHGFCYMFGVPKRDLTNAQLAENIAEQCFRWMYYGFPRRQKNMFQVIVCNIWQTVMI